MSVGIFVVSIVISMIAERGALRLAHQEFGTSRWGRVSVFVAGMAMSAVLAAVSVAVSGGPGSYGVIALVLLLGFDIVFCATEARADDNTRAQVDETEAVSEP